MYKYLKDSIILFSIGYTNIQCYKISKDVETMRDKQCYKTSKDIETARDKENNRYCSIMTILNEIKDEK